VSRLITVVVPVYRGLDDVVRCVSSVWRHLPSPATDLDVRLLIVDDASPEAELSAQLDRWAADPDVALTPVVLRNEVNRGFVASVNRALAATPDSDVVLLNADTVVTAGWLERLADAARPDDVGTVTPLTGFGSICTLPPAVRRRFDLDGPEPRIDDCAAFVLANSLHHRPRVIAGVGFCLYVTRRALDACGAFDEHAFGRGYGEEVDFCLRATRLGFAHVVEDATFVHHSGGGSFGIERAERMAAASQVLHQRYPFFRAANRHERLHDPLDQPFMALELALERRDEQRPHVLHLLHSPPSATGGTEKHLDALLRALEDEVDFSILYPVASAFVLRTRWRIEGRLVEREYLLPGAVKQVTTAHDEVAGAALATALDLFPVDAVHVQHLNGHSLAALQVLDGFDGPVVYSVRDGHLLCPLHSLLYRGTEPCGVPGDLDVCARCTEDEPTLDVARLVGYRSTAQDRIDRVDHWVFASQSIADHMSLIYQLDPDRVHLVPHGAIIDLDRRATTPDESLIFDEPLRLAFVGRGWAKKGMAAVNRLADHFAGRSVELHHFGGAKDPASPHVVAHGPYDNDLLPDLLQRAGVQVVLLPGPYAETFGHVMTEALVAGRPVIGARYGALGERIRATGAGWTIDPLDLDGTCALVEHLDVARDEVLRATRAAIEAPLTEVAATAGAYARLYRTRRPGGTPAGALAGAPR
jgi:GT2 family glycosyltransferase